MPIIVKDVLKQIKNNEYPTAVLNETPPIDVEAVSKEVGIDVQALIDALGNNKENFLDGVEQQINKYIADKTWQECLTITQLNRDDTVKSTWRPDTSKGYCARFFAFVRKTNYEQDGIEYKLDSILTQGVVDEVNNEFNKFYASEAFSSVLFQELMKNHVFAQALANAIAEATQNVLNTVLKKQLSQQMAQILQNAGGDSLTAAVGQALTAVLGKVVSVAVAAGISKAVLAVVMSKIALLLTNVLATTAVKATLISLVKKLAAAKVVAVILGLVAAGIGSLGINVSVSALLPPIMIAIVAWIIHHEISNLPSNMGVDVSKAVRAELDGNFADLNRNVVIEIVRSLTAATLTDLAAGIATALTNDPEFRKSLDDLK